MYNECIYIKMAIKYKQKIYFKECYTYICVNEEQDTSKIQQDILNLLACKSGNLFMVGDEDQSIYGFRAAYPEALVQFEKIHLNTIFLGKTYFFPIGSWLHLFAY